MNAFANSEGVVEAWYAVARTRDVRVGRVHSSRIGRYRIALWRKEDGSVVALHARCAHLGADLSQGRLVENRLQCPFHHWQYDDNGCTGSSGCPGGNGRRQVFAYPTAERFGLVWIWYGPEPTSPLPDFLEFDPSELKAFSLPRQNIPCHHHLITANGLDEQHMTALHEVPLAEEPVVEEIERDRVAIHYVLSVENAGLERLLRPLTGPTVRVTFTNWRGSVATVEGFAGAFPLLILFAITPDGHGGSRSQSVLLWPRRASASLLASSPLTPLLAFLATARVLSGDREVLSRLDFRRGLTRADRGLTALVERLDPLPFFDPERT